MKRMLFNATQSEELRVAIVDGQKLIDLDIETAGKEQRKSNIYKGVITRIEPSLEAAFVNYGTERHGFLPFKEVARSYFLNNGEGGRARIQDALKEGQELIVQVDKDERGNKGAALTTFISLAGRYLVLMPNNPRGGGVSRRIEGEDRNELRDTIAQLEVPGGMSIIARTAGIGRSLEELQWDLNYLLQLWTAIEGASTIQSGAFLIYQEGSLVIRAIRDYFQPDIGEILIDTPDIHEQAVQFMNHVMPGNVARVKLYQDETPLFSRFQIEHQIETAFSREVRLPSGGAIVIDHTEALVSIDVNSGRSTKGSDIEQTALNTNLEAADEAARQLRLRDLGGLVVIDFIDMENQRNQREVENHLREALHYDRARVQTGKISRFGLLELSRQRLRPSLGESNHIPCPRCHGTGHIRGIESTALHILRITQEEAMKENSAIIQVQLPVEAATFLLNEKRADIHKIEQRMDVEVVLIPNIHMETPNYSITRLRSDDVDEESSRASYQMVEMPEEDVVKVNEPKPVRVEAAVKGITPASPAPAAAKKPAHPAKEKAPGFFSKILSWLSGNEDEDEDAAKPAQAAHRENGRRRNNRNVRNTEQSNGERTQGGSSRSGGRSSQRQSTGRNERQSERTQSEQHKSTAADSNGEQSGRRTRGGRRERGSRNESTANNNQQQSKQAAPAAVADTTADSKAVPAETTPAKTTSRTPARQSASKPNDKAPAKATAPAAKTVTAAPEQPAAQTTPEQAPPTARNETSLAGAAVVNGAESKAASVRSAAQGPVATETTAVASAEKTSAAVAEKTEKKPRAPRRRKPVESKPLDLTASGLQLVETRNAPTTQVAEVEPANTPRKQRKPAAWQQQSDKQQQDEPLVIVQTQK